MTTKHKTNNDLQLVANEIGFLGGIFGMLGSLLELYIFLSNDEFRQLIWPQATLSDQSVKLSKDDQLFQSFALVNLILVTVSLFFSLVATILEFDRVKDKKGKTMPERYKKFKLLTCQNSVTNFTRHLLFRGIFYILAAIIACFNYATHLSFLCFVVASFCYLVKFYREQRKNFKKRSGDDDDVMVTSQNQCLPNFRHKIRKLSTASSKNVRSATRRVKKSLSRTLGRKKSKDLLAKTAVSGQAQAASKAAARKRVQSQGTRKKSIIFFNAKEIFLSKKDRQKLKLKKLNQMQKMKSAHRRKPSLFQNFPTGLSAFGSTDSNSKSINNPNPEYNYRKSSLFIRNTTTDTLNKIMKNLPDRNVSTTKAVGKFMDKSDRASQMRNSRMSRLAVEETVTIEPDHEIQPASPVRKLSFSLPTFNRQKSRKLSRNESGLIEIVEEV